ncbi:hypothetical protein VNO80_07465 [Phaseolus coccineus]|uniref:Non-specific lipid-transfer protein n=1 Tax=Phaseolus coccineus TaxID=3886 RepID=A0AAN9NJD5_PHACN
MHHLNTPQLQIVVASLPFVSELVHLRDIILLFPNMASLKVACMVVMCMGVLGAPMMVQAISCGDVTTDLAPCLSYLINGGAASDACCAGVRSILGAAGTTSDKQTVCNCLKDAANNFGINENYAQALPGLCNVSVPYKISRSTNCANIRF